MRAVDLPRERAAQPDTVVVDVRSAFESRRGHVQAPFTFRSGRRRSGRCRRPLRRRRRRVLRPRPARLDCGSAVSLARRPATSACSTATWLGGGAQGSPSSGTLIVMAASPLSRLRRLCLALPEAHEVIAWGEPTFRVRNKMFATFASAANHHGRGRYAAWVKALPVNQDLLVRSAPQRVFVPPYVGPSGSIGLYLDDVADWDEDRAPAARGVLVGRAKAAGRAGKDYS